MLLVGGNHGDGYRIIWSGDTNANFPPDSQKILLKIHQNTPFESQQFSGDPDPLPSGPNTRHQPSLLVPRLHPVEFEPRLCLWCCCLNSSFVGWWHYLVTLWTWRRLANLGRDLYSGLRTREWPSESMAHSSQSSHTVCVTESIGS